MQRQHRQKITQLLFALALLLLTPSIAAAQGCGPSNPNCIVPTVPTCVQDNRAASTAYVAACSGGGSTVSSVSNSDGTLTISPTIGSVVASLNLGHANTWTAAQTFNSGDLILAGVTSGTTTLIASAAATGTLTLPAATDQLIGRATTDTLTFKTFDTAGNGNVFRINSTTISGITGVTGTTSTLASASGTFTSGNCLKTDANHNIVDQGAACGSGGGGTPGGASGSVQFNNAGAFGGFGIYTAATHTLQLDAVDAAAPAAQTLQAQSVIAGTSNTAGVDWTFNGSKSTGNASGGNINFAISAKGASGTQQNADIQIVRIAPFSGFNGTNGAGILAISDGVSGNLTPLGLGGGDNVLQVASSSANNGIVLVTASNDAIAAGVAQLKTRATNLGGALVAVQVNDQAGVFAFLAVDTGLNIQNSAAVFSNIESVGNGFANGNLSFQTGSSLTEQLRLSAVTGLASFTHSVFGYGIAGNGDGGAVTQATSKSTGVTLSTANGTITMNNAALASQTTVSFVLTNTKIAATDHLVLNHNSVGTLGGYTLTSTPAAGSATINVRNVTAGSLSEAIVIDFTVIKGTTS